LEIDEDIKKGLLREVKEETRLKVSIKKLFGMGEMCHKGFTFKDKRKLDVRVVELGFLCDYVSGEIKLSDEHQEYKWASRSELKSLEFSPDSKDILEQYLNE
jgi:8-oxo-dGTP diphosphatase